MNLSSFSARPGTKQHASPIGLDLLVRKEISLGLIREIVPPQSHLGLQLFPWLPVTTDDVVFHYAKGMTDGLAPARAEDAEAELAQTDDIFVGSGRASVMDWSVKNHYTASDVSRYRDWLRILEDMRDKEVLELTAKSATEDFIARMARDTAQRKRKLDNRIEWLIMESLSNSQVAYNDGKVKWSVAWGRPAAQAIAHTATNINGDSAYPIGDSWLVSTGDPIRDITSIQEYMYATYGVRIKRAIASRKVLNSFINSDKFTARAGMITQSGSTPVDLRYLVDGWGPLAAQQVVEQQTGIQFIEYDSVYRTRAVGSQTFVNNRFLPENRVIFLPDESDVAEFDDTPMGLGKTLTAPHPAGNWSPGFYSWEKDFGVDPWGKDVGSGVKAFPVFPHMDLTFTLDVYS